MPLHRAIKNQEIEFLKFKAIKLLNINTSNILSIIESCCVDKYDSVNKEYNTNHSVDMFNLYSTF